MSVPPPSLAALTPIVSAAQFVNDLPEFANTALYPVSTINYWITVATMLLNPGRWGNCLLLGAEMYVAHNLVLESQAAQTAAVGGLPGLARGPISSESPGSVSLSYAVSEAAEPGGGYYNLTVYGQRFYRWVKMFGAGPLQLGIGLCTPLGSFGWCNSTAAWEGPDPYQPGGPGYGT